MSVELEYGFVSAVDLKLCRIKARLPDRDDLQSHWLTVPQRATKGTRRRPLMPELGEQVALLLDADGVRGTYLGGVYSTSAPPPVTDPDTDYMRFSDGTEVSYNRESGTLSVKCVGQVDIRSRAGVTVTAPTLAIEATSSIQGDLVVEGSIQATGTIMDVGGNSNHHSH